MQKYEECLFQITDHLPSTMQDLAFKHLHTYTVMLLQRNFPLLLLGMLLFTRAETGSVNTQRYIMTLCIPHSHLGMVVGSKSSVVLKDSPGVSYHIVSIAHAP